MLRFKQDMNSGVRVKIIYAAHPPSSHLHPAGISFTLMSLCICGFTALVHQTIWLLPTNTPEEPGGEASCFLIEELDKFIRAQPQLLTLTPPENVCGGTSNVESRKAPADSL